MPGKYDGKVLVFDGSKEYNVSQPEEGGEVTIDFNVTKVVDSESVFERRLVQNAAFTELQ